MRKQIGSLVLSAALAFYMVPAAAFASQSSADSSDCSVATVEGTPGVDYVDGDVLVAVRGGQDALESATQNKGFLGLMSLDGNSADGNEFTVEQDVASISQDNLAQAVGETTEDTASSSSLKLMSTGNSEEELEILLLHGEDTASLVASLSKLDCVAYAQPNYFCEAIDDSNSEGTAEASAKTAASGAQASAATSLTPSNSTESVESTTTASERGTVTYDPKEEPFYDYQWSLKSNGVNDDNLQRSYENTTAMDVAGAWDSGAGQDEEVVVAVLDSGVDYTHEDMRDNMWTGGDAQWSRDLGGGTYGYDAIDEVKKEDGSYDHSDPMDRDIGHGTHCATTIAASWNGTGIAGVNGNVKIMACRFLGSGKSLSSYALVAYNYIITAKQNGVNIVAVNNSWGSSNLNSANSTLLNALLYKAGEEGIISLFAAGNSSVDNDLVSTQSRNTANPYLLQVGALDSTSKAAVFSQRGQRSVDIFAPGTRVLAGTTNYGVTQEEFTNVQMNPQYTPWLNGTSSAKSTYLMEEYESSELPDSGITYDLIAVNKNIEVTNVFEHNTARTAYKAGSGQGYLSDGRLEIPLQGVETESDEYLALRITISAQKWSEIVSADKGDDLYVAMTGGIAGSPTNAAASLYFHTAAGYVTDGYAMIGQRDGNWYCNSKSTSLKALTQGAGKNGNISLLLVYSGKKTSSGDTFTEDDYIYFDDFSLGWATCGRDAQGNVTNSYYYSDGTSMATPNATGVVSLLAGYAASQTDGIQDAATASKIVSYLKGGVTKLDSLKSLCDTGGVVNASKAYVAFKSGDTSSLLPVCDAVGSNGDGTCTLTGSFFGSQQGTLSFDGQDLEVKSWDDNSITFVTPIGGERSAMIEVCKVGSKCPGQSTVTMPSSSSSYETFSSLPVPNFEVAAADTSAGYSSIDANEMTPVRAAAAKGYIYEYCVETESETAGLLRYDIESGAWDKKNYLVGDLSSRLKAGRASQGLAMMAAGESEIYLCVLAKEGDCLLLLTFDAATGDLKYETKLSTSIDSFNNGSMVVTNHHLMFIGGTTGNPIYRYVYPDTGETYEVSSTMLKSDIIAGIVTPSATGVCITGSYSTTARDYDGYSDGVRNNEYIFSNGVLAGSKDLFFGTATAASQHLQSGQKMTCVAAAGVDGGVILTGPLSNVINGGEVADTWSFDFTQGTWKALGARCYPTGISSGAACTYNGVYYVLGSVSDAEDTFLMFRSASLEDLGQTDGKISEAAGDADCAPSLEGATVEVAPATYTGKALSPQVVVTVKDADDKAVTLVKGKDYEVSCDKAVACGTYKVTVTGIGLYTGTATGEFVVRKGESRVTLGNTLAVYTGKPVAAESAEVAGSTGALTYKYYADGACTQEIASRVDAGTYYAVASVAADDNYEAAVSEPATVKILKSDKVLTSAKRSKLVTLKAAKTGKKKGTLAKAVVAVESMTEAYGVTCGTKASYELLTAEAAEGKVKVSAAGKVTAKKGLAKGAYTLRILASCPASANYSTASERTLYLRILVK